MNFELSEEQQLLAETPQALRGHRLHLRRPAPRSSPRRRAAATMSGRPSPRWGCSACPSPRHGGFGGTAVDVMVVMEAIGEGLLVEPYLATVGLGGQLRRPRRAPRRSRTASCPRSSRASTRWPSPTPRRGARYDLRHVGPRARAVGRWLDARRRQARGAARRQRRHRSWCPRARRAAPPTPHGISLFLVDRARRAGRDGQGVPHDRQPARGRRPLRRRAPSPRDALLGRRGRRPTRSSRRSSTTPPRCSAPKPSAPSATPTRRRSST